MANQRFISLTSLCAAFFAFGVIALGAFTRLIDAGLGCPDWPGCYGHLTVPFTQAGQSFEIYKAWAEMIHRYFVAGLSFFILVIIGVIFLSFFKNGKQMKGNFLLAGLLLLLLAYQILLGRWTVTLKLLPIVVTQHLLGGFFILSILWLIYLNNNIKLKAKLKVMSLLFHDQQRKLIRWGSLALMLLLVQIFLGAWTSTHYASLSCPDFPFCLNDQLTFPSHWKAAFNVFSPLGVNYEGGVLSTSIRQTIQMAHRMGALVLTLYLLVFCSVAVSRLKKFPALTQSIYLMLGLLVLQICMGVSNVIFKLPLITAISHNLIAVLLLLALITFLFKLVVINRETRAC